MYMRGGGMRGYRGLGQGIGPGTLNCPGDPGCPGQPDQNQMIASPLTPSQIAALSAANVSFFNQPSAPAQTLTTWLNQNSLAAIIGIAIFLVAWKALMK